MIQLAGENVFITIWELILLMCFEKINKCQLGAAVIHQKYEGYSCSFGQVIRQENKELNAKTISN